MLAQEGADIIAVDIASQIDTVPYAMATPEDLAQTVKEVSPRPREQVSPGCTSTHNDWFSAATPGLAVLSLLLIAEGLSSWWVRQSPRQ
jgi:hypothetical protein